MSNDTQVQAHMALVDKFAETCVRPVTLENVKVAEKARAAVEASARQLAEQAAPRVVDKSELKRLVTQVFGDDFHIVRQAAPGFVMVRAEVVEFLQGAKPLDGLWFGERHPAGSGLYWWRQHLTAARPLSAATSATTAEQSSVVEPVRSMPAEPVPLIEQARAEANFWKSRREYDTDVLPMADLLLQCADALEQFATPPPAPVLLTDAEIREIADSTKTAEPGRDGYILPYSFARAVEAEVIRRGGAV